MQLVSPSPVHPLGREMQLIALFRKADSSPVPEMAQYPLRFTGQVTAPDGSVSPFLFYAGEGGLFYADKAFQPRTTGLYQVSLTVSGWQGLEVTSEYQVKVAEQPYLVLESPTSGSVLAGFRQGLPIMASLYQGNQPVLLGQALSTNPNSLAVAEVVAGPKGGGWRSQAIYLDYREDLGKLQGVLPISLDTAGSLILKLELIGRLSNGEEIRDAVSVSFQVVPTFWDSINRWYIWGGLGVLILLALSLLVLHKRGRPRLFGTIHYQGEMFDLDRRFRFTIGGSGCDLILSSDLSKSPLARLLAQWEESEPGESRNTQVLLESKSSAEEREFQPPRRLYDGERFLVLGTYEVEYRQS